MADLSNRDRDPVTDVLDSHPAEQKTDLTNCDREPIHLCGAIQPHGVLLGVDEDDLTVRWASANAADHLGIEASKLLGASLSRAAGERAVEQIRGALGDSGAAADPLVCRPPAAGGDYELTWHRMSGLLLVELEPAAAIAPAPESSGLDAAMRAIASIQPTDEVATLCDTVAAQVKTLTGYDRVMVYRFHPDWHGEVIAEVHEPGMEPFLGLHYPASDIPRQARKLYLLNYLRMIVDVDAPPTPLLDADGAGGQTPVNLGLAALRAASPIHLTYLRNMGVQATLTLSLTDGTRLWGMIACHHRSARRIDANSRATCRLLAQVFSRAVTDQEEAARQAHLRRLTQLTRQILCRMSLAKSAADALAVGRWSPLELTAADGMVACIDGHRVALGSVPPENLVADLLTWLSAQETPSELICDDLPRRFPEFAPFAAQAAGVLAVPLSPSYQDYALWFRGEWVRTIRWGGDPDTPMTGDQYAKPGDLASVPLGPRRSFSAFRQEIHGRCRPWLTAEIDTARALADAIPEMLLEQARGRLARRARRDQRSGLPNQERILSQTAHALGRGEPIALLRVDLDHFGRVNESLGRSAGDQLIHQAAHRLGTVIGERGVLAHAGGDDFIVLCHVNAADQIAEQIVDEFRNTPFVVAEGQIQATASIGIAAAEPDATADGLLKNAGIAMFRMKKWGGDDAALFSDNQTPSRHP